MPNMAVPNIDPSMLSQFGNLDPMLLKFIQEGQAGVDGLHAQTLAAQQAATGAFGAFQQAGQQPEQQVDPTRAFAATLAGNISQAISPRMGGQQAASDAIAVQQDKFHQQHLTTLNALQMNYNRLASQAENAGNHEQAADLHQKSLKAQIAMQAQQDKFQAGQFAAGQAGDDRRLGMSLGNNIAVANINAGKALDVERMRAQTMLASRGFRLGADGNPVPLNEAMSTADWSKGMNALRALQGKIPADEYTQGVKMQYAFKTTNEATSPSQYLRRLKTAVTTTAGWANGNIMGMGKTGQAVFTPNEVVRNGIAVYGLDMSNPADAARMYDEMKKAGYSATEITTLLKDK